MIRHPVSLRSLAKLVQGIKGRDPAPLPPATLLKGWDVFEHEVSYIWKNAHAYNEDGSVIVELAEEIRVRHFSSVLQNGTLLISPIGLF